MCIKCGKLVHCEYKEAVIIAVEAGVASLIQKPNATKVFVRDYDVEGGDYENLQEDESGDEYVEFEI